MHSVVVGLGKTGASCLRYLAKRGIPVSATDTRRAPPGLAELGDLANSLDIRLGGFDLSLLDDASQVLMSPGVSLEEPIARSARARGIEVLGDIELFARAAQAPVLGITGTNGKSTVTSMVALMAATAGRRVLAGGNLGKPALDLLEQPVPDLYVLELSSFQLETTSSLRLKAAVVLNVTADHLDRYPSVAAYALAKSRIFAEASTVVLNADDPWVAAMRHDSPQVVTFSIEHTDADFSLLRADGKTLLARGGKELLDISRMKISGLHNAANALAALALGEAAGLPMSAMLAALQSFAGLAHRSAWVADVAGVRFIDDSKGTNVGATIAAVAGMQGPLVMIAGGEGKGQDFT
ncbi:MAG: UDP-N-acetylmuramoyl-L-alanine--D-glutamate ligase, partial [Pseudomonadota bacterium]|nr:UDP-N-acetylmuramoyl-L-alanine--D-glutamate ligase [Pseudomonadota bacterium]